jgi:hypothetical protein
MTDEIEALRALSDILDGLPPDAVARILKWAADKHKVPISAASTALVPVAPPDAAPRDKPVSADLPEYFNDAQPRTSPEKALVVAAWLQAIQGSSDFDSGSVNRELKNLGHQSSNITRDFDDLMGRKPKMVVQTRKSGNSKQARKLYRVTHEGLVEVSRMRGERQA